jgi:para-nitrobenzyl esterase
MSGSSNRTLTRREALLLSATAGIGMVAGEPALASDSIKTAAHQEPGNVSTPRSAIAKTQYGKVRGFLDGGVLTFKGVPYGATTAGENRWLPAKPPTPWTDEYPALCMEQTARKTCIHGLESSRRFSLTGTTGGRPYHPARRCLASP